MYIVASHLAWLLCRDSAYSWHSVCTAIQRFAVVNGVTIYSCLCSSSVLCNTCTVQCIIYSISICISPSVLYTVCINKHQSQCTVHSMYVSISISPSVRGEYPNKPNCINILGPFHWRCFMIKHKRKHFILQIIVI